MLLPTRSTTLLTDVTTWTQPISDGPAPSAVNQAVLRVDQVPPPSCALVLHVDEAWTQHVALFHKRADGWHFLPRADTWSIP